MTRDCKNIDLVATTFRLRKVKMSPAYLVHAIRCGSIWQRIGPFGDRRQARFWIATNSAQWLKKQTEIIVT